MAKGIERGVARAMRAEHGTPIKVLAAQLGVSPSSVSLWVRDIEITHEHFSRNLVRAGQVRGDSWRELNRKRRRSYQRQGRERAREGDLLHQAGCMLYWAEGSKGRNTLVFANSDPAMLGFFRRFLNVSCGVGSERLTVRLNVYLGNGRGIEEIEAHWLAVLDLPRSCLRKHTLNHFPTSSSGGKGGRLPYGVCTLKVLRSTPLLQHIYGAIQEYARFDEPRWLDGLY